MNPRRMLPLSLGLLVVPFLAVSSALGSTQTVVGSNTYPNDHQAVQSAINLAGAGGTVVLDGTFNFGVDGGVEITLPDLSLMGGSGGATITGKGKVYTPGFPCLIFVGVGAVGCRIQGLTLTNTQSVGISGAIAVRTTSTNPSDNPVVIEKNTINVWPPVPDDPAPITGRGYPIWMRANGCPMKILDNTLSGAYGAYVYPNTGDVLISGNTITSRVYGMYVMQNSRDCIVTDNVVYGNSQSNAIHVCTTPGTGKVQILRNRTFGARFGINVHNLGMASQSVPAEIADNYCEQTTNLPVGYVALGLWGYANQSPINVLRNVFRVVANGPGDHPTASQFGIFLSSWNPVDGIDQDNGAVLIRNNEIEIRYPMPAAPDYTLQVLGMLLGDGNAGLSNVTVECNRLAGSMTDGIVRMWYGHNTVIARNDFSGLQTWEAQLWLLGGQTIVKDNKLGFANQFPGFSWGVFLGSGGVPPSSWPVPPHPTENCVLTGNDYRATGLPGWTEANCGCILLQSFADAGGYGTEVRNNLIAETGRFPLGTGGAGKQVYENRAASGLVHDNRIIGQRVDLLADPGIGQKLKTVRAAVGACSISLLEQANGKKFLCETGDGNGAQAAAETAVLASEVAVQAPALPSRVGLIGNYPNPFNPSTTICFGLKERSRVSLEVFNTLGQGVARLVNGDMAEGYHEVVFDASRLPSGVYFYRLQVGNMVECRRLLLLR